MRIMFNTMGLGKGGAERVINLLSNSLVRDNDVLIVTNINSKIEYKFDDKIIIKSLIKGKNSFLRKIRRLSLNMVFKLKKIIITYNPDIIISFLPEPSFRLLALKKHCKRIKSIPVIVSIRNDPYTEYKNPIYCYIMKKLYPYADQLVLQTSDSKKYFEEKINFGGVVIQNPVSDEFLIKKYCGKREKRIVAVGRLNPQKNYFNMIDAFSYVARKHNDYVFNIYGDGLLKDDLQKYIDSKEMHEKILLMGKVDKVKEAIYKASVFVLSSDYEGMPNSLLEAACMGLPCVSTDCPCGGPREILKNGKNGILVPINSSEKLANEINRLIENPKLAEKYSTNANGNNYIYSKEKILKVWQNLITEIMKG